MKSSDIVIRDPFVLLVDGTYYMYGTRSATCWGEADGFDCYASNDLIEWKGPFEVFHKSEDFFADRCYWAPECYAYQDKFFLITTFGAAAKKKGIYALCAESPLGPFVPWGEELTPPDWNSIDGTLWFEGQTPWLVFSHPFEDVPSGDMCCVRLKQDLSAPDGAPEKLFSAPQAPWAKPIPFAKKEFGMDGDVYFTDGPCLMQIDSVGLCMTWSSWGLNGYAAGVAVSESGMLCGPWKHISEPIFPDNGGHGMMFHNKKDELIFAYHSPNDKLKEHPQFADVNVKSNKINLVTKSK